MKVYNEVGKPRSHGSRRAPGYASTRGNRSPLRTTKRFFARLDAATPKPDPTGPAWLMLVTEPRTRLRVKLELNDKPDVTTAVVEASASTGLPIEALGL